MKKRYANEDRQTEREIEQHSRLFSSLSNNRYLCVLFCSVGRNAGVFILFLFYLFHLSPKIGFSGELCNYEYNECDSNPCLNDGQCTDHIGGFTCKCTRGYTGKRCHIKVSIVFIFIRLFPMNLIAFCLLLLFY